MTVGTCTLALFRLTVPRHGTAQSSARVINMAYPFELKTNVSMPVTDLDLVVTMTSEDDGIGLKPK